MTRSGGARNTCTIIDQTDEHHMIPTLFDVDWDAKAIQNNGAGHHHSSCVYSTRIVATSIMSVSKTSEEAVGYSILWSALIYVFQFNLRT